MVYSRGMMCPHTVEGREFDDASKVRIFESFGQIMDFFNQAKRTI